MNFFDFIAGLKGDLLKQKILQLGISPNDIQGIDFNNMNDLNRLAEKIVPNLIKSNPNIANLIKQNSSSLLGEKSKEVCEVIDMA
ncbi:hypothetical protein IJU97_03870 [bacterium]|nr:hypothetical protein [bacterium]